MELALQIFIGVLVAGISGAAASWLAFRISFERFKAYLQGRDEGRDEWRKVVDSRLDAHAADLKAMGNHEYRIQQQESHDLRYQNVYHTLRDDTLKKVAELYEEKLEKIMERLERWKDEMIKRFGK